MDPANRSINFQLKQGKHYQKMFQLHIMYFYLADYRDCCNLISFYNSGTNKFNVSLPASASIANVKEEAEKFTKIPASSQKLIINGKALTSLDDNKIITDCRIQDGTKIMVLGKKYDIEADVMYQKIIKVEENIISIQKKLSEVCRIMICTYCIAYF